jgi:hypothetical protein|tara:strand:- start:1043 stop:1219 length:177 start_codon:yes stop_codon:yes gene_type:complete
MTVNELIIHMLRHYQLDNRVLVHTETNGALLFCEAVAIHRIDKDTIAIVGKKGEDDEA